MLWEETEGHINIGETLLEVASFVIQIGHIIKRLE